MMAKLTPGQRAIAECWKKRDYEAGSGSHRLDHYLTYMAKQHYNAEYEPVAEPPWAGVQYDTEPRTAKKTTNKLIGSSANTIIMDDIKDAAPRSTELYQYFNHADLLLEE